MRDRNPVAFQLKNTNLVGSVWKTGVVGDAHRDNSYYVFDDWSWLNGVKIGSSRGKQFSGGETLKSYVNGVGLKIESVKDNDSWESNSWQKKRDIRVKRVLMSSDEGYRYWGGYRVFDKGTCFLKTTNNKSESSSNLYLLIGFAKGFEKDNGKRPERFEFVEGYKSFCDWYAQGKYGTTGEINVSFYLEDGETIKGTEYPVIASQKFEPLYFQKGQEKINAVILGVAIKGQMKGEDGKRAGERLTKERAKQEIRGKVKDEIVGIFPNKDKNKMFGFKIKKNSGGNSLSGSSTDSWISDASATYKY